MLLACVVAAVCAACDGDPAPAAVSNGRVGTPQLVGALDRVDNPDQPVYGGAGVHVHRLWRVAPDALRDAVALAVSPQRVLVLDAAARRVRSLWLDGRAGPDLGDSVDLVGPRNLAFSGGIVAVADTLYHGVVLLDASGNYLRTVSVGEDPYVLAAGGGRFAATAYGGTTLRWKLIDASGHVRPLELAFPPSDAAGRRCPRVSAGPFLVQASCNEPSFQVLGPGGKVARKIRIERPRPGARPAEVDSLQRLVDGLSIPRESARRADLERALDAAAGEANTVLGVRWDPVSGRYAIWSRTSAGTSVDLLSREGVYLARFRFAPRWRDLGFRDGVLYAIEARDGARPAVAAYRLELPGEQRTRGR
jgi:hypothetical protein